MAKNGDMNNYLTVRVSVELRTEFVRFCKSQALSPSQAIALFVQYYIRTKDATCCFINDDAQSVASDKSENLAVWLGADDKARFAELAKPNMSILVRGYMRYCIVNGIPEKVLSSDGLCSENRMILQEQVNELQRIREPLLDGAVDDSTARQLANDLSIVCDRLGSVIDTI